MVNIINSLAAEEKIEEKLSQSAELISKAFKDEKITNYIYNFSKPENLD